VFEDDLGIVVQLDQILGQSISHIGILESGYPEKRRKKNCGLLEAPSPIRAPTSGTESSYHSTSDKANLSNPACPETISANSDKDAKEHALNSNDVKDGNPLARHAIVIGESAV